MAYNPYMNFQNYQFPNMNQVQNGGFVCVRSESEARNYPIAYGNSITFKDETAPYVYVKTMGFSQLDRPVFEKFRLVKEDAEIAKISDDKAEVNNVSGYALKSDLEALEDVIKAYKAKADSLEEDVDDLKTKIADFFIKKTEPKKK